MKSSLTVSLVHGPGRPPDHASIVADTMFFGAWKSATGSFAETSRTNACQSGAAAVSEIAGFRARGLEWSLLPIHTPTASAGAFGSSGGPR
jgi:hypothetical protein